MSLRPSAEDTIGPYYPIWFADAFPKDLTIARHGTVCRPRGEAIAVLGRLIDKNGDPVPGALVELWQANADGRYRTPETNADPSLDPNFHGFGRIRISGERFEYRTIKPGRTEGPPARAPHISLTVFCDGISRVTTQLFFDDEDNTEDPLLRSLPADERNKLIARRVGAREYAIDLVLSGDGEAPFFDDTGASDRTLRAGETDMAAEARVPQNALRAVPEGLVESFVPYYPPAPGLRAGENDMTRIAPGRPRAEGDVAVVRGNVTDEHGRPLPGVLLEIWNANPKGRYTHIDDPAEQPLDPNFYGFGRVLTGDDGSYQFTTIRPGAYLARADIGRYRPAHVHFSLIGGRSRLITQMYFDGDEHLARDPAFSVLGDRETQERQIATKDADGAYRFDIVIPSKLA